MPPITAREAIERQHQPNAFQSFYGRVNTLEQTMIDLLGDDLPVERTNPRKALHSHPAVAWCYR